MKGTGVIKLLMRIKEGKLAPRQLSKPDRQRCVQHLEAEGLGTAEIAEFLRCCDRTIRRDRKQIQDNYRLEDDPDFPRKIAGQHRHLAEVCIQRIRRATKDKGAGPGVRIEGERAVFDIQDKMIARLQSLALLPNAGREIHAELVVDGEFSLAAIRDEAERLQAIDEKLSGSLKPSLRRTKLKKVKNTCSANTRKDG